MRGLHETQISEDKPGGEARPADNRRIPEDANTTESAQRQIGSRYQGSAVLLGVTADICQLIRDNSDSSLNLVELGGLEQLYIGLEQGRIHVDILVIGISLDEPVRIAQRIHSMGVDISVVILTEPAYYSQLEKALKFAPFVGRDVTPYSTAEADALPGILLNTAIKVRKRRQHRGSMEAAQASLGKISDQQPRISHYFERLLDRAPIGVLNLNVIGAILSLNRHACQVLDVSERDALGVPFTDFFAEHERDRLKATIACCVAPLGRTLAETFRIDNIATRYVEVIASSLVDRSGQLGSTIIMQDVTARVCAENERKKAVDELRASEHRYRELVETMNEALALMDTEYRITFVNRRFCDLFGYQEEEIIGRPLIDLVHQDTKELMCQHMAMPAQETIDSFEMVWSTSDARTIYTLTSPKMIFDDQGQYTGCLGVFTDITERKEVEQREKQHMLELAQASRVSTIGEMSSQIAHELAQPLSAIGGLSTALLKLLNAGTETREDIIDALSDILTQSGRAREIVIGLRDFVRNNELRFDRIELNELVNTVIRLANVGARWDGIEVNLALDDSLPRAVGDRILIEQAMLNLIRNACEAMQTTAERRVLSITTRSLAGGYVEVSVGDTGPGLDGEMMKNACTPFITTKSDGMGMGLAIVRSILEAHKGRLSIVNNPQGGAVFSFTLPVSKDE